MNKGEGKMKERGRKKERREKENKDIKDLKGARKGIDLDQDRQIEGVGRGEEEQRKCNSRGQITPRQGDRQ